MKIKIEPERLKSCIDNAMIYKTKPTIDPVVFIFEPEKVTNFGIVAGNIGTYQEHKKNFFLEYECKEKEIIPITDTINTKLKWGFDIAEMTAQTSDNKINFSTEKGEKYDDTLENYEPKKMPWDFVFDKDINGFVPVFNFKHEPEWDKKTIKIDSLFEVEKDKIKSLPPTSEYELIFDKSGLVIRVPEGGVYSRPIEGKVVRDASIQVKVDTILFTTIVENLNGKIRMAITEDMILFIEDRKDHSITYFLATQIE